MPKPGITLESNQRVFICGKTGSGKTFLARYLTESVQRLIVLDGKGTLGDWNLQPWTTQSARKLLRPGVVRLRALAPLGVDPGDFWDEILLTCYAAGHCTIYIDELYAVCPPNKPPSNAMWAIYTRGRELGLGVWASTQRPVWVPLITMSESEHYFMFRLQLFQDRGRLSAFMGEKVLEPFHDVHGFFYMRADMEEPVYIRELDADSGSVAIRNQPFQKAGTRARKVSAVQ